MSDFIIEKYWTISSGPYTFPAAIIRNTSKYSSARCGYVGVDETHPLYQVPYHKPSSALKAISEDTKVGKRGVMTLLSAAYGDEARRTAPDMFFDVHGSLTYSGESSSYPVLATGIWWFGFDCSHLNDGRHPGDTGYRELAYVTAECESLARQLGEIV